MATRFVRAATLALPLYAMLIVAVLPIMVAGVKAFDDSKYPDLKGQWRRAARGDLNRGVGGLRYDATKPPLLGQEAPLTAEYQAIYEANLADQAASGQGIDPTYACLSPGMPRVWRDAAGPRRYARQ